MNRLLILLLMLLVLAGCNGGTSSKDPYENLQAAIDKYQFPKADSLATQLLKQDTTAARAPYLAGLNKERQLLLWDAMQQYLTALARDHKYAPAFNGLYRIFSSLGSPMMAADAAKSGAELLVTDINAWVASADALMDAGQFSEAQRAITQAASAGLTTDAVSLLNARLEFLRHNIPAAESSARIQVSSVTAKFALASYLETHGYQDSAMAVARSLFEQEGTHEALLNYFFTALRTGYLFDARQAMREMLKRDQTGVLSQVAMVLYYDHINDHAHARDAAFKLQEMQPLSLSTFAYITQVTANATNLMVSGGVGDELMATIDQLHLNPILKQYAIYRRIIPRARLMAPPLAILTLDSITMEPMRSELDFQGWYAFLLQKYNRSGDTLPTFEKFTEAWQEHPALWTAYAATYTGYSPKQAVGVDSLLSSILEKDPFYRPTFDSLWTLYGFTCQREKQMALFERYPHYLQTYPDEGLRYAIALAAGDRGSDAIAEVSKYLSLVKGNAPLLDQLVRSLVLRGFPSEAMQVAAKALEMDNNNADLLAIAARAACESGDAKQGLKYAESGLKIEPDNRMLKTERGRALFDSGDEAAGLNVLDELVNAELGNADALMYLSQRLAQKNQQVDRAQDLGRQALITAPLSHRASVSLAYVYLATGRNDLARGAASMALEIYPEDAEAYYLLGKAFYLEKNSEAKGTLRKALQNGLKGAQLQDAQAILQRL